MMKYLLDTCVITAFIKNNVNTVAKIKQMMPKMLCVSVITIMEIEYGIRKMGYTKQSQSIAKISGILVNTINKLDVNNEIAVEAGKIRAELAVRGMPIGAYDLLIAVTAKYYNLVMVTSNTSEFGRVQGLQVENWYV